MKQKKTLVDTLADTEVDTFDDTYIDTINETIFCNCCDTILIESDQYTYD